MSFWASAYQGYRQRDEELLGKRQKISAAFNEFRRLNPTATAAEFNAFIDAQTGGDRYLKGAVPDQMLSAVTQEADRQRQLKAQQEALADMETRQKQDNLITGFLQESFKTGESDTGRIAEGLFKRFGIDDPTRRDALLADLNARDVPSMRQQFIQGELTRIQRELADDIPRGLLFNEAQVDGRVPEYVRNSPEWQQARGGILQRISAHKADVELKLVNQIADEIVRGGGQVDTGQLLNRIESAVGDPTLARQLLPSIEARARKEAQERAAQQAKAVEADRFAKFQTLVGQNSQLLVQLVGASPDAVRSRLRELAVGAGYSPQEAQVVSEQQFSWIDQSAGPIFDAQRAQFVTQANEQAVAEAGDKIKQADEVAESLWSGKNANTVGGRAAQSLIAEGYFLTGSQLREIEGAKNLGETPAEASRAILTKYNPPLRTQLSTQLAQARAETMAPERKTQTAYFEQTRQNLDRRIQSILADKNLTNEQRIERLQATRAHLITTGNTHATMARSWVTGGFNPQAFQAGIGGLAGQIDAKVAELRATAPASSEAPAANDAVSRARAQLAMQQEQRSAVRQRQQSAQELQAQLREQLRTQPIEVLRAIINDPMSTVEERRAATEALRSR